MLFEFGAIRIGCCHSIWLTLFVGGLARTFSPSTRSLSPSPSYWGCHRFSPFTKSASKSGRQCHLRGCHWTSSFLSISLESLGLSHFWLLTLCHLSGRRCWRWGERERERERAFPVRSIRLVRGVWRHAENWVRAVSNHSRNSRKRCATQECLMELASFTSSLLIFRFDFLCLSFSSKPFFELDSLCLRLFLTLWTSVSFIFFSRLPAGVIDVNSRVVFLWKACRIDGFSSTTYRK